MMRQIDNVAVPKVSVVIPSYNRKECLSKLLEDLYRQEDTEFEVVVVDDCSTDGSADFVAEHFPRATLLRCEKNGGPCVARNLGIMMSRSEIIVGFDTDVTIPDRQLLHKTEQAFREKPDASGFAFRILQPNGIDDDEPRWWHPVPLRHFADRMFETSYFCGTAYAFRRASLLGIGLYPEWLYMHYEEIIVSYRLLEAGLKMLYNPDLVIVHHAKPASGDGLIDKYYTPRNQLLFAAACLPFWNALTYMVPRLGFQFLKALRRNSFVLWARAIVHGFQKIRSCDFVRIPIRAETVRRLKMLSSQRAV